MNNFISPRISDLEREQLNGTRSNGSYRDKKPTLINPDGSKLTKFQKELNPSNPFGNLPIRGNMG